MLGTIFAVAISGTACHHAIPMPAAAQPAAAPTVVPATPPPAPSDRRPPTVAPVAGLSEEELFRRKSLDELNAERPLSDVFFDYDRDTLRDEGRMALEHDAAWLSKWRQTRIVVDGHCDERGTAEYNLALGDRRATVVKEYLTSLGVTSDRIQTRSMGKEAPFCHDSGESCWSQNRRGHFVITAK
jgi:peptidoglycan-associated lipoprotein